MYLIVGSSGVLSLFLQRFLTSLNVEFYTYGRTGFRHRNGNAVSFSEVRQITFSDILFLTSTLKVNVASELSDIRTIPEFDQLAFIVKNFKHHRLIFFSSAGSVYGSFRPDMVHENSPLLPISNYGRAKVEIEKWIQDHFEGRFMILRIANPFGVVDGHIMEYGLIPNLIRCGVHNKTISIYTSLYNSKDYFSINYLLSFVMLVLRNPELVGIYNLGSGISRSISSVLEYLQGRYGMVFSCTISDELSEIDSDMGILNSDKSHELLEYSHMSFDEEMDRIYNRYQSQ